MADQQQEQSYRSHHTPLVAFLRTFAHPTRSFLQAGTVFWEFDTDSLDIDRLVTDFRSGSARVEPKAFYDAIRACGRDVRGARTPV